VGFLLKKPYHALFQLTFPAFELDKIEWGISKLKETAERFA
jgi:hypothetical protein